MPLPALKGRCGRSLAAVVTALIVLTPPPGATQTRADPEAPSGRVASEPARAERHMIAAANPLAAQAGLAMLRAGGSAADAAIAALLVLNVVEPQSSGIGGGAFALVHGPEGLTSFDAREKAPDATDAALFLEDGEPLGWYDAVASGRSVGVPGLARLMETLHIRHGRLDWPALVAPAIRLADEGFPVSPRLAASIEAYAERLAGTDAAAVFMPGGAPLREGAILRQPRLAASFRMLAERGADALYTWPLAAQIVAATRRGERPGALALEDLAAYELIERAPVCLDYRVEWRICGMGPPSSGATTVAQILGLMEQFGTDGLAVGSPRLWHLFAEASRLAYADRARYLADPDQVDVPLKGLLDHGYLTERARLMRRYRASEGTAEAGEPPWREARLIAPDLQEDRPGTTHLSVIDADGLAISLTASIETAFGSARMAGGFLLNNQLTDFSFRPTDDADRPIANAPDAGKRPRSSMAPTIVYRVGAPDAPVILAGSPGGSRIPEYVAGALIAMIDYGLDPAEAAARSHVSHRNRGVLVLEEGGHEAAFIDALEAMGHEIEQRATVSGLHLILRDANGLTGGADPRREGIALGD